MTPGRADAVNAELLAELEQAREELREEQEAYGRLGELLDWRSKQVFELENELRVHRADGRGTRKSSAR